MFSRTASLYRRLYHQRIFRAGQMGLMTVVFTGMQFFPVASKVFAQSLVPGLVIENQATGSYVDPTDSTSYDLESNVVRVTVVEVAGITVIPTGVFEAPSTVSNPGPNQGDSSINAEDVVYFSFQVTNVGNDPTQFFIPGEALSVVGGTQAGSIEITQIDPDGPDGDTVPVDFSASPITIRPEGNNTGDATALGMPVGSIPKNGTVTLRVPVKLSSGLTPGDTATVIIGDTAANDNTESTQNQPYIASTQPNPPAGGFDLYTQDNDDNDEIEGEGAGDPQNGDTTLHRQEASASQTATVTDPGLTLDYGDAPDNGGATGPGNYQTTAANSGPSHVIDSNLYLGTIPDGDDGTQENIAADLDDTSITADEGAIVLSTLEAGAGSYTVSNIAVTNNTSGAANLVAWIDFDNSGTFDASEAQTVVVPNTGTQNMSLTWSNISDVIAGTTYVRFRLTTDTSIAPTGDAANSIPTGSGGIGEIEDYQLTVTGNAIANDLEVTKTTSDPSPYEGGAIVYTITATNAGNNPLTGIEIRDNLPGTVLYAGDNASQGDYDNATGIWTVGDLASGESATLSIVVTVFTGTAGSTISNTASLEALDQTDENSDNDSSSVDIIPLSTSGGIPPAVQPTNICFPIADSGAISGSGGNDRLTRLNKVTEIEEGVGDGTGTNDIEAAAIQPGTGVYYAIDENELGTIDFQTGQFTGYGTNISSVSGFVGGSLQEIDSSDIDVDGMSFDLTTGILYGSLRVSGEDRLIQIDITTGDHVPEAFGSDEDYIIIQANNSLEDIDGIAFNITGRLYGIANNSSSGPQRIVEINKFTGATTNVGLVGDDLDLEGLSFDFQGNLYATSGALEQLYQLDPSDASILQTWDLGVGGDYEAVSCVLSPSDLEIVKTVDDAEASPDDTITYTLTLSNSGTSLASGVEVTDILPAGVTYDSSSASQGSYDSGSGLWDVGVLEVGETATLEITGTIDSDASTTITNTASISAADQPDINLTNNTDSADINFGQPEVTLVKRITAINDLFTNPHDGTILNTYIDAGDSADDNHPNWPDTEPDANPDLYGAINGGVVKPNNEIEYTIYFLSSGNITASNVTFCDRIPDGQTFVPNSVYTGLTPNAAPSTEGIAGEERGILVSYDGSNTTYTNIGGDDTARFYPPGSGLPPACNLLNNQFEHNGAVVVDLGDLPISEDPGTPANSHGFVRFRATIDE